MFRKESEMWKRMNEALPPVNIHPLWTEDHLWYPRAKEIGWALQYSPELGKRGLLGISYMSTFEQC